MGHYCWLCGRMWPNEGFSNRGRRVHECQRCRRSIPPAHRAQLRLSSDLERMLRQSRISSKNVKWAESLAKHDDEEVRNLASIVAEIGRVHPHRRRRHAAIRRAHAQLWERMVAAGLVEGWLPSDRNSLAWDERPPEFDEPWPEPEAAWIEAPDEDDDADATLPF
jgi:hypothetical protein